MHQALVHGRFLLLSGWILRAAPLVVVGGLLQPGLALAQGAGQPAGEVNAAAYGARCDGVNDDAPAFNAAISAIRARPALTGGYAWPLGRVGRLTAPRSACLIRSSLNMTGLYGAGFFADLEGTVLLCQTGGTPCVDATGLGNATISGLSVQGSCEQPPSIGLVIGRITNDHVGADHDRIVHPTITGCFLLAPFFNNQSESTLIEHAWFTNQQADAYGAIWDGANAFNVQSAFTGKTYPAGTPYSFNENTCVACIIGTNGAGSVPVYIGASARHAFVNGYVFYSPTSGAKPGPAVILDTANGPPDFLDLDVHFEDNGGKRGLTSVIEVRGGATPVLHGLRLRDNYPEQSGPIFLRGAKVVSVAIEDADIQMGRLAGSAPRWWDDPGAWRVSGRIYSEDGSYVPPGQFSGQVCVAMTCTSGVAAAGPTVFHPESGAVLTLPAEPSTAYVAGRAPLATLTLRLPPLTGRPGQVAEIGFGVAVRTLNVQDSKGAEASAAPISAHPASTLRWWSLGMSWVQVQ